MAATGATTASPQQYAVSATSADAINKTQLAQYGEVGTQVDAQIELTMPPSNLSAVKSISWVTDVRPVMRPKTADPPGSSDGESLGVEQLHQNGITGDGVTVGIIDSGFDQDDPAIASNVAETVSFRQSAGRPDHGTSVAQVVTQTAPDSQLYLASAGTDIDHQRAIEYLAEQDVDIIVYSIYWPAVEDDGDHFLTDDINSATQQGTLFVAIAGNEAERHWEGQFRDTDQDRFHEWGSNGDELNALPNTETDFAGGEITAFVRWEDEGAASAYRPALFNPATDEYVAIAADRVFQTQTNKYAVVTTTVESQPLDLVIRHSGGVADDEIEVMFLAGPTGMERSIPASSVTAPGDVPAAITTGAYVVGDGMATYSGRGPTDDGRLGVDLTGYTNILVDDGWFGEKPFGGTSAAAPYVGGVAALMESKHQGDLSPAQVTRALKTSSDDVRAPGADTVSGAGVVNAEDAVDSISTPTATPTPTPTATPTPTPIQIDPDGDGRSANADGTGEFDTSDGEGYLLPGATAFQGESDILLGNAFVNNPTKTIDDSEGVTFEVPNIPQNKQTGRYTDSNGNTVTLQTPRVTTLDVLNTNGESVAGGSVSGGASGETGASNLTVVGAWNYEEAENLELTVEDSAGLDVTAAATDDAIKAASDRGTNVNGHNISSNEVGYNIDLSNTGTYVIKLAGTDDLDFGEATQSTTVTVTESNRLDTNGQPGIQFREVLTGIAAYNNDRQIGGQPVTFRNVLELIAQYNSNNN
ncbi:S8 family serine peptidase [Haloplanus salinarum]|uniref:S8 family serine peptidase n=1 Tax=Haloplanus salinarum TaxID=1912324 RepID=UPI003B433E35